MRIPLYTLPLLQFKYIQEEKIAQCIILNESKYQT